MRTPIITDKTIMLDESFQKIIMCCKDSHNYIDGLKYCIAEITGSPYESIENHTLYFWLRETYLHLGKISLFISVLNNVFSPAPLYSIMYKDYTFHERFVSIMCSQLATLQINEHNSQGRLVALIDTSKAYKE